MRHFGECDRLMCTKIALNIAQSLDCALTIRDSTEGCSIAVQVAHAPASTRHAVVRPRPAAAGCPALRARRGCRPPGPAHHRRRLCLGFRAAETSPSLRTSQPSLRALAVLPPGPCAHSSSEGLDRDPLGRQISAVPKFRRTTTAPCAAQTPAQSALDEAMRPGQCLANSTTAADADWPSSLLPKSLNRAGWHQLLHSRCEAVLGALTYVTKVR